MYGNQHGRSTAIQPELTPDNVDLSTFRTTLDDITEIVDDALPYTVNAHLTEQQQTVVGALSISPKSHPNQAITVTITPQMTDPPYIKINDRKEIAINIIAQYISQSLAARPENAAAIAR